MTRVWLPEPPEAFGGLPAGIEPDVWDGGESLPDGAGQVEYVVVPQTRQPAVFERLAGLPSLKTIQILSAGAEHVLPYI